VRAHRLQVPSRHCGRSPAVYINNARVTKADVGASNGVIHVINRVLIPPAD
jgi:uncharacterized surface protein with fasciclin (FAS1) repeats